MYYEIFKGSRLLERMNRTVTGGVTKSLTQTDADAITRAGTLGGDAITTSTFHGDPATPPLKGAAVMKKRTVL